MNGEEEPVWLTPNLRDVQPEEEPKINFFGSCYGSTFCMVDALPVTETSEQ